MMLNVAVHGESGARPGLLIAHGLFGSARNWGTFAKRLSDSRQVVAVDMRNHGASPWSDAHGYEEMAADLAEVLDGLDGPHDVLGHSMGGKAAMILALSRPDAVNRLIVADIAPIAYSHDQLGPLRAMKGLDPASVEDRQDASRRLEATLGDSALAAFLLQSLDLKERRWRLNLDALERGMERIMGFPEAQGSYGGPCLFLSGAKSDYVRPEHRPRIRELFPAARFAKIRGAGHWLHAEKPREFEQTVRAWLG